MRRKILQLVAIAVICLGLLPITSGVALAAYDNCNDGQTVTHTFGQTNTSPSASRSGVKATIDISTGFHMCVSSGIGANGNINVFVEIFERGQSTSEYDNENILRLGIVECRDPLLGEGDIFGSICKGEDNPVYYWGHPAPSGVWYDVYSLGNASYAAHELAIYYNSDGSWNFSIDSSLKASLDAPESTLEPTSENLGAVWGARTRDWDDAVGDGANATWFTTARYGRYGLGWYDPLWPVDDCQYPGERGSHVNNFCYLVGHDSLKVYSSNP